MANAGWSLAAGGAALGVAAGFFIATTWSGDRAPTVPIPGGGATGAQAPAGPNPDVVKALETQAARIKQLEASQEKLSVTVRELTRALREATEAGGGRAPAAPSGTLPWLPAGALEVAKAWYVQRIAASIQELAKRAETSKANEAQKRAWAEQGKREAAQLQSLRSVISESQFAAWLQSTGHGERVPTKAELEATARALAAQPK